MKLKNRKAAALVRTLGLFIKISKSVPHPDQVLTPKSFINIIQSTADTADSPLIKIQNTRSQRLPL